jgi:hypothetical protein
MVEILGPNGDVVPRDALVPYVHPTRTNKTPIIWPLLGTALKAWAILMIEWGTLRWVEHAPEWAWVASTLIAVAVLAVLENREWLNFRGRRYFSFSLIVLMFSWAGVVGAAYYQSKDSPQAIEPKVAELQPQIAAAPAVVIAKAPSRSPADAEKEVGLIDSLLQALRDAEPILQSGRAIQSDFVISLSSTDENVRQLFDRNAAIFSKGFAAVNASFVGLEHDHDQYFQGDIDEIVNAFNFEEAIAKSDAYIRAVTSLEYIIDHGKSSSQLQDAVGPILNLQHERFGDMLTRFQDWIASSRTALMARRNDLSEVAARAK